MKIAEGVDESRVTFLRNLPVFANFSRNRVMNFYWELKKVKYVKGQNVFREGD